MRSHWRGPRLAKGTLLDVECASTHSRAIIINGHTSILSLVELHFDQPDVTPSSYLLTLSFGFHLFLRLGEGDRHHDATVTELLVVELVNRTLRLHARAERDEPGTMPTISKFNNKRNVLIQGVDNVTRQCV